MADGTLPAGWGFASAKSFAHDPNEVGAIGQFGLPDMPVCGAPARRRAAVIAWLIRHPLLLDRLSAVDLMRRYDLERNRAGEMLAYARAGRVPGPQGRTHQPGNQYTKRRAA